MAARIFRVAFKWDERRLQVDVRQLDKLSAAQKQELRKALKLLAALREINFGPPDHRQALERALRSARARDVYSLLRLSIRLSREERGLIYDRASGLAPPPPGVTRQACIDRESGAFEQWVDSLGLGNAKRWWVHWRDVL